MGRRSGQRGSSDRLGGRRAGPRDCRHWREPPVRRLRVTTTRPSCSTRRKSPHNNSPGCAVSTRSRYTCVTRAPEPLAQRCNSSTTASTRSRTATRSLIFRTTPREGTWPGEHAINNFETFLVIVAFVALLSALFLIANTMSTLVSEQHHELGVLKAIGGRRGQIHGDSLRTATLFGAIGGVAGATLCRAIRQHTGQLPRSSLLRDPPVVERCASSSPVASIRTRRRDRRVAGRHWITRHEATIHEALADDAAAGSGATRVDRALRLLRFAPMTSVGLRSVNRRRSRSAATVVQVAISVAAHVVIPRARTHRGRCDQPQLGPVLRRHPGKRLHERQAALARDGRDGRRTTQRRTSRAGLLRKRGSRRRTIPSLGPPGRREPPDRKFTEDAGSPKATTETPAHVIVVGDALAHAHHLRLGASVEATTQAGRQRFRIIGIDDAVNNNGRIAYLPLATLRATLGDPQATNGYWIQARRRSNTAVDRLSTAMENQLGSPGYSASTDIFHVDAPRTSPPTNRS